MNADSWKRISFVIMKMLLLLIIISIVAFTLVEISPIDPVNAYVGGDIMVSQAQREEIAAHWGLNDPPIQRFLHWFVNIIQGDMGTSLIFRKPVIQVIRERFALSLSLMLAAWVLSGVLGFAMGILASAKRGKLTDRIITTYCLLLSSTPAFWIGMVLLLIFSVWLNILPMGLAVPAGKLAFEVTLGDRIYHMILPALALSLSGISNIAMHTREKLNTELESDCAVFARSRGESTWTFIRRHGIRNILLPAVTLQFCSISELFGGSVLAETVFSYPGLGQATVDAGLRGDIPLLLGITLFSAVFVFCGNLAANLLYPIIDPRTCEGGRLSE